MDDLGQKLRQARQDRGWTLEALSAHSGLSTGFLSQVERGQSTLSIVSLSAICQALELPIETLFMSNRPFDEPASVMTKAEEQLHIRIGGSPVSYGYLTRQLPAPPIRELLIAEFPAGTVPAESTHEGEEFGYVLEGALRLRVRDEVHDLAVGDSYRIAAGEPHDYATTDASGARVLMAVTQRFIAVPDLEGQDRRGRAENRDRREEPIEG
jgi:transcriptional regulator with XRE-family HTH domain